MDFGHGLLACRWGEWHLLRRPGLYSLRRPGLYSLRWPGGHSLRRKGDVGRGERHGQHDRHAVAAERRVGRAEIALRPPVFLPGEDLEDLRVEFRLLAEGHAEDVAAAEPQLLPFRTGDEGRQLGLPHRLIRQPETLVWQIFLTDPNGAKVELDFAADEAPAA